MHESGSIPLNEEKRALRSGTKWKEKGGWGKKVISQKKKKKEGKGYLGPGYLWSGAATATGFILQIASSSEE